MKVSESVCDVYEDIKLRCLAGTHGYMCALRLIIFDVHKYKIPECVLNYCYEYMYLVYMYI